MATLRLIRIICQSLILSLSLPQEQQPFFRQLHDSAQLNQPNIQKFSEAFRAVADNYEGDKFLMGESYGDDPVWPAAPLQDLGVYMRLIILTRLNGRVLMLLV